MPRQAQAMQAIGYKEICRALAGECTMDEAVEQIKIHSRQYAKRQMTWLARDGQIRWLDADTFETPQALHGEIIFANSKVSGGSRKWTMNRMLAKAEQECEPVFARFARIERENFARVFCRHLRRKRRLRNTLPQRQDTDKTT